ncbi:MAG: AbrB/MazE/SpoVT family DNA-binding domain-containing protein [Clostridiales bacterium]|nr:AbrB/MazE/SpoVT family DNA-binding domain-containing protein [Clostridiales bacterium]
MKATGIVRRIDDLGRIVLPKEIRRTLRIREGDPLEIYTDSEGGVVLRKFSPVEELSRVAGELIDSMYSTLEERVLVTDTDKVVAVAGGPKREYLGKEISPALSELIRSRKARNFTEEAPLEVLAGEGSTLGNYTAQVAVPIVSQGDPVGALMVYSREEGKEFPPAVELAARMGAGFLARQMEG